MIYLDNAATTRVKDEVLNTMLPYLTEDFYNPSAGYGVALDIRNKIETAREIIAKEINAEPEEIYFTSGGSESNSWVFSRFINKEERILTTNIEHPSILQACEKLKEYGNVIDYLHVNEYGFISMNDLVNKIGSYFYGLVSIQFANNEIGTIQDIKTIGRICRQSGILFHTDAVQAFGHIPIDVKEMNIDMLSASGHKIGAPKGVGFLYVRKGISLNPLIFGSQEDHFRGGTYNVPGIIAFGKATELLDIERTNDKVSKLRDALAIGLLKEISNTYINGTTIAQDRLSNNLNVRFEGIQNNQLLYLLSEHDIYASAGSACSAGENEPSHVLKAIGLTDDQARNSIRFSLSDDTTEEDINEVIKIVSDNCKIIRMLN